MLGNVQHNRDGEEGARQMELYINSKWTECYGNSYIAEAIAWSENGNHASIYTMGNTAEEADAKLMDALRELKLVSETSVKTSSSKEEVRGDGGETQASEEESGL
jgi:hypothetical protein